MLRASERGSDALDAQPGRRRRELAAARRPPSARRGNHPQEPRFPLISSVPRHQGSGIPRISEKSRNGHSAHDACNRHDRRNGACRSVTACRLDRRPLAQSPAEPCIIGIAPCGEAMCGTVTWASQSEHSRTAQKGADKLVGAHLLTGFRPSRNGQWHGKVFVPDLRTCASAARSSSSTRVS